MEQGRGKKDSVFDFLFVDNHRIELYLSQFSRFGKLTNLVESVSSTDSTNLKGSIGAVSGTGNWSQQSGVQRHYDAQWVAPLTFLEEIEDREMLKRGLSEARVGDLVLIPGTVNLANLRVFERTWEKGISTVDASVPKSRNERRRSPSEAERNQASGLQILATLEQPLFMLFSAGPDRLWSTINPASIVGSATDIHLKHGLTVSGTWHLVGILDCLPSVTGGAGADPGRICGDAGNEFSDAIKLMLREHRNVMGRPSDCFGVTPLILMRQVT